MRTLHFDCFAGASGNMILGALLAVGVEKAKLEVELAKLGLPPFELRVEIVDRSGLSSTYLDVLIPDEEAHRHLHQIAEIIEKCSLSDSVKQRAVAIFTRLAEAEAKVHGIAVDKVHFHEVGALDAIIDIIGACICFEMLGIERFTCSRIHVGSGFVQMAHGKFPVPPPAVAELLKGVPIYSTEVEGELVTPTGAAIISTLCDSYGMIPEMRVEGLGYGAGTRNYDGFPNTLRLILGGADVEVGGTDRESLVLIETNIDDMSPQIAGFAMERAFELGALDCWFTPIQMKKDRPAFTLSLLCSGETVNVLKTMLYHETTTIGLRISNIERECLEREIVSVPTEFGDIDLKVARVNNSVVNAMPEYEDVRRVAIEANVPFREVQQAAMKAFEVLSTAKMSSAATK